MAQSVLAGRRMKRVGLGALITWEMYWLCPCGTAPRGHCLPSPAFLMWQRSCYSTRYTSVLTQKQVLFVFKDKLSYTTRLIID